MATVVGDRAAVSVGRVFGQAFGAIFNNPAAFFGLTLVFGTVPSILIQYVTGPQGMNLMQGVQQSGGTSAVIGLSVVTGIVQLFLSLVVQGALVRATVAYAAGQKATIGDSIAAGSRAALPLLGLALLIGICVGLGMILLVVPGVILYIMWSVAAPALVEERTGITESLSRSSYLTKGARWRIFGIQMVLVVIIWLFSGAFALFIFSGAGSLQNLGQNGFPLSWLIPQMILSLLLTVFWSATQNSLYVELRRWKDGYTPEHLADVFA
jgi:uncharacterized membrane protein